MPADPKDKTPTQNHPRTVEIPVESLPAGMSPEDFLKGYQSFLQQRQSTKVRDEAIRKATKELVKAHKSEYDELVKKFQPTRAA